MANDLKKAFSKDNIHRAWRWLNTNPDYKYKNYFRDIYTSYAISLSDNIDDLIFRLKSNTYEPTEPGKLYIPKPSGIMRPITLLSIEDQIVYQSFINIIAEYHLERAKKRYYVTTFGNLYAGKSSLFFHQKWDKGYKKYTNNIKKAYIDGNTYIASFDLTAFYDSIDYKVIDYFLTMYGIDKEFIDRLKYLLSKWTTNKNILHGHGIPQGPLASGLLSEVVLSYLDEAFEKSQKKDSINVKYYRYVDDIRLMGKSENPIKMMLVRLDYYSKQVGLFPQSSKTSIKHVTNINEEIKDISAAMVETIKLKAKDPKSINKEILSLIKKNKIENTTKFKILLANSTPSSKLTYRILQSIDNNYALFDSISVYLKSYPRKVPDKIVDLILLKLQHPEIYQIVNAHLLGSIFDNLSPNSRTKILQFAQDRWSERNKHKIIPFYRAIILSILLSNNALKYSEIKDCLLTETNWWVLKSLIMYIDMDLIGRPSYIELIKILLQNKSIDISICSAHELIKIGHKTKIDIKSANHIAQKSLKFAGIIKKASGTPSVIQACLDFICNSPLPKADWKKVFGKIHREAENKIVRANAYVRNDMSAFVNVMDVFNDLLLECLYSHNSGLGKYNLGNMGSVLNATSRLAINYPDLFHLCRTIHEKRLQCDLSHPIHKSSKSYTRPIEYKYIKKIRPIMLNGYKEFIIKW
ncbi:MAG: hypothetical protein APF84_13685 [Gracilibacter sp. BRH_c7a]|nr:MAG: hypothetical protein APF84_13685 [Gracilibacter sp. BRH_c7a]